MGRKVIIPKSHLFGKMSGNRAMKNILRYDTKHVFNTYGEKHQLFDKLKAHRSGGVTKKELRQIMAELKYGNDDDLSVKEINTLAQELGMKTITKKYLPKTTKKDPQKSLKAAKHKVDFLRPRGSHKPLTDKEIAAAKEEEKRRHKHAPYKSAHDSYMEMAYRHTK